MLKRTITFNDYSEPPKKVTKDFYFNLNQMDMAELQFSKKEGFIEFMKRIVAEEDAGALIQAVKELLSVSVGRRHEDNIQFLKTPEITSEFINSNAYPTLFTELLANDGEDILAFILGIIPPEYAKEVTPEALAAAKAEIRGETPEDTRPAWIREDREPTSQELTSMSQEQLQEAFRARAARESTRPVETLPSV
jgi:hypothetical protein